jgi:hypothetical protein
MDKSVNPLQATGNDPQSQAGGDRDGGTAGPPSPPNPVDPNDNPPSRGGDDSDS